MNQETIGQLVPLFQTLVWAVLILTVAFSLRKELKKLLDRFSGADDLQMSLGSLTVQAKTMRELHSSIGTGFPDDTINKAALEALLDIKIKSIQAAMEHTLTKGEARGSARIPVNEKVKIIRADGKVVYGTTIDVSDAGIGFKSGQRLRFGEVVKVKPRDPRGKTPGNVADPFKIIRIEESNEGYYYGATISAV